MAKAFRNGSGETPPPASGFPLFFRKPTLLQRERHGGAGLLPAQDYSFAAGVNSILINSVEFAEAARHYPIVFTQSDVLSPAAVLGLEQQNYFVDAKGGWKKDAYIPAYVRKYPFVFTEVPKRKEFLLCIDEAAPQYREKSGKDAAPLYEGNQPSELTRHALEFCTAFHNHHQLTRRFCDAIGQANILSPSRSTARLSNGREIRLGGFQVIDEKKLKALPAATIVDFHKKGWLPLIYCALISSSNWKALVDLASAREPRPKRFKAPAG